MKKIAIIGSVGYPSNYGGFETLVHHLVEQLHQEVRFTVYCSKKNYPKETRKTDQEKARLVYLPFQANGIQSIIYDTYAILHALFYADTLLILGVPGCIILPFIRLISRKKIIVNIDGLEWKRAKWNWFGKRYLKFCERMAVKWAHIHIADNEAIKQYVMSEYNAVSSRIEYGADHVMACKPSISDYKLYPFLRESYAFKVARIEPENNIHILLEAFSTLKTKLVIVGNWNNSSYGKALLKKYNSYDHFQLLDPIYDQQQLDVLRSNCWLYVHGHSAGGTNPSLVEAMYLGLPILAFNVIYNKETTEYKAFYFNNIDQIRTIINDISYTQLQENGEEMRIIAQKKYTWKRIATLYHNLFKIQLQDIPPKRYQHTITAKEERYLQQSDILHLKHRHHYFEELD